MTLVCLLLLAPSVAAQQPDPPEEPERSGLRWRNRPSLQIGEHVRIDLRLKLQADLRHFDPDIDEDEFDFRVRRAGLRGEIGNHFEFDVERDLESDGKWRDVYLNWRTFRQAEVMAGRFKVPFGREELIGITDVDFVFRSLVSTTIPPARDKGVMVHGRFFRRGLTYQVGVFEEDGDNGRLQEPQFSVTGDPPGLGPSAAGRLTVLPLRAMSEALETFRVGAAYGVVDVPEGLNSLRGVSVFGTEEFFEPVYVQGLRQRYGVEAAFTPGSWGFAGEWMQSREERREQGIRNIDLSDLVTTGWYGSVTWLVTGEDKDGFERPRRALFNGGIGAIELGARYEELRFESAAKVGPAFSNPRAENILINGDAVWTFGLNWFANRWVRITANAIHEEFEDADRTPLRGTREFWSGVLRLQVVF